MKIRNWLNLSILSLLSLSCGGSNSGSEYISVSSSSPAQLSAEQANALSSVGGSVGTAATNAASAGTTNALVRASQAQADGRAQAAESQSFEGEDFESGTIDCDTSGTIEASGSYNGSFSASDNGSFSLNLNTDITATGDDCIDEDGKFDGEITATMTLNMDIQISQNGDDFNTEGTIESIVTMNGDITAEGYDDEDNLESVSISYNDFKLRVLVDAANSEDSSGFDTLYDDSASTAEQIAFLEDNLECSGSVTIDGEEYDCGAILARMIEDANES